MGREAAGSSIGFIRPTVSRDLGSTKIFHTDSFHGTSLFLNFSICKMRIICYILSCKDIDSYLKVFQNLWLKDIKYIEMYIITAILWLKQYIMFSYIFFI